MSSSKPLFTGAPIPASRKHAAHTNQSHALSPALFRWRGLPGPKYLLDTLKLHENSMGLQMTVSKPIELHRGLRIREPGGLHLREVEAGGVGGLGGPVLGDDVLGRERLLAGQGRQPHGEGPDERARGEAPGGPPDVLHVLPLRRVCLLELHGSDVTVAVLELDQEGEPEAGGALVHVEGDVLAPVPARRPSLPSPSALPYQVAVAGCHSGSTTLCAAPEASAEPKRHAPQTTSDARSTALAAEEELEEAAMARAHVKSRARRRNQGKTSSERTPTDTARLSRAGMAARWYYHPLLSFWDRF